MNNRSKATILAAPLVFSMAAVAHGQSPFTLRAGIGTFTDRDFRRGTSDNGFLLGIGYNLGSLMGKGIPGQPSINFDFLRGGDDNELTESMSVTYEMRWGFGGKSNFMPYWGLGVGVFRGHYEMTVSGARPGRGGSSGGGSSGGGPVNLDQTFIRPGGKVIVGAWLSDRIFIESQYRLSGQSRGFVTDSINFMVGVRF